MKKSNGNVLPFTMMIICALTLFAIFAFAGKGTNNIKSPAKSRTTIQKNSKKPLTFCANLNNIYYYNSREIYLNLEIKADELTECIERTPLNISVVIDKSGSMASKNKLEFVKKAVEHIIENLNSDDYFSLVTYDDNVKTIYSSSKVEDKQILKADVRKILSGGFTNLSGGMNEGFDQVERTYKMGYVNRVLLLSDGIANRGITDRGCLNKIVKDKSSFNGITISTFGVGNDFNENLMVDLATYGKGNSYYIKNSVDIPEIFSNELSRIRILAAQETKIKVRFPSEYLSVKNVFGYHYQVNGDEVVIDLKDIFSGQKKSILIKFNVDKRFGSKQTLECFLTYNDVKNEIKNIEEKVFVYITPVKTISEYETGVNVPVTQYIVKQEANDIMEQALYDVENGNYQNAREKVKKGKEYMKEQMNTLPQSGDMDEQYNNLDKYGQDLDNIETKTDDDKKGIQKDNKYKNYGTRNK